MLSSTVKAKMPPLLPTVSTIFRGRARPKVPRACGFERERERERGQRTEGSRTQLSPRRKEKKRKKKNRCTRRRNLSCALLHANNSLRGENSCVKFVQVRFQRVDLALKSTDSSSLRTISSGRCDFWQIRFLSSAQQQLTQHPHNGSQIGLIRLSHTPTMAKTCPNTILKRSRLPILHHCCEHPSTQRAIGVNLRRP